MLYYCSMKTCTKCNVSKSINLFNKNKKAKDGYTSYCKECAKIKSALWAIQNPKRRKKNQENHYKKHSASIAKKQNVRRNSPKNKEMVKTYGFIYNLKKRGLNLKTYEEKISTQNNKCEICARKFTSKIKPAIDHWHTSGKTRGILCIGCNASLGHIERPDFLEKAFIYINKYKSHL